MSHETYHQPTGFNGNPGGPFNGERPSKEEWDRRDQNTPDMPINPPPRSPEKPNDNPETDQDSLWLRMRKKVAAGAIALVATVGVGVAVSQLSNAEATQNNDRVAEDVVEPTEEGGESEPSGIVEDPLKFQTYEDYPFSGFGDQPYENLEQQMAAWQLTSEDTIAQDFTGAINQIANYTPTAEEYANMGLHELALSNPNADVSSINDMWEEDGAGTFGEEYLAPIVPATFTTPFPGTSELYPESVDTNIPVTQFIVDTQMRKYRDPSYESKIEVVYSDTLSGLQAMGTVGIGTEMWVKFTDNDPDTEDTYQIWRTSTIEVDGTLKICDSSFQEESKEQLQTYADQQNLEVNL